MIRFYLIDVETLEVLDVAVCKDDAAAWTYLTDGYQPGDPVEILTHDEYVGRLIDSCRWSLTAGVAGSLGEAPQASQPQ